MTAWGRSLLWAVCCWLAGCPLARADSAPAMAGGVTLPITQPTRVCDNYEGRVRCMRMQRGTVYDFDARLPLPAVRPIHGAQDARQPTDAPPRQGQHP